MVLQERIELSTSPLPRECSTTELLQRRWWRGNRRNRQGVQEGFPPVWCKLVGSLARQSGPADWTAMARCAMEGVMRTPSDPPNRNRPASAKPAKAREDRLKAALKANMARRKAQAKARNDGEIASGETASGETDDN